MKKIIRLTEGDLIKVVKKILSEARFNNQQEVDYILGKVSKHGMDSLTDREKRILNNPDDKSLTNEYNNLEYVKDVLIQMEIVDESEVKILEEDNEVFMEIKDIASKSLDFFKECDGVLSCNVQWDDGIYHLTIGAWGPPQCMEERVQVYEYFHEQLKDLLIEQDISISFKDFDDDITNMYDDEIPLY